MIIKKHKFVCLLCSADSFAFSLLCSADYYASLVLKSHLLFKDNKKPVIKTKFYRKDY